jgi:thioesterase domain-containing protein
MASLTVGASVVCTAGFDAETFFAWLGEFHPTWYTAVPTMHQAILSCLRENPQTLGRCSLRFIRSCSSALPARVKREMEETFHVPVIEAYGMTEAAHQICSNPLPPGVRKENSVGLPTGTEVAIRDVTGGCAPAGEMGEVVIRSPSLMSGYDAGPQSGFDRGWFATGDRGFLDAEGYLFLTGRLYETINRGGQRVSPQEIESVLAEHPAVAEAVAFAVPHPTLGQDVAAAVVLRVKNAIRGAEIRQFAAARLVGSKIPRRVLIVEVIPRGATGKLQRDRLAEQLGVAAAGHGAARSPVRAELSSAYASPESEREQLLAGIWQKLLRFERVGVSDNFFELGGDSLLAEQMIARAKKAGFQFTAADIFHHQTIAELADMGGPPAERRTGVPAADDIGAVSKPARGTLSISNSWSCLVGLQENGSKPPFFWIHGENSTVFLPRFLGPDQPVYGVLHQSRDGKRARYTSVEDIAALYLEEIQTVQPAGPYLIGGFCTGGLIAFEMAQQLRRLSRDVELLILVDPPNPGMIGDRALATPNATHVEPGNRPLAGRVRRYVQKLSSLGPREKAIQVWDTVKEKSREGWVKAPRAGSALAGKIALHAAQIPNRIGAGAIKSAKQLLGRVCYFTGAGAIPASVVNFYLEAMYARAARGYQAGFYPGRVIVLNTEDAHWDARQGFERLTGSLKVVEIDAKHDHVMYYGDQIQLVAEKIKLYLEQAQAKVSAAGGDAQRREM